MFIGREFGLGARIYTSYETYVLIIIVGSIPFTLRKNGLLVFNSKSRIKMLSRFKYLIIGAAIISSFVFTIVAFPIPAIQARKCRQVISNGGEHCSYVRHDGVDTGEYYCIGSNRWVFIKCSKSYGFEMVSPGES